MKQKLPVVQARRNFLRAIPIAPALWLAGCGVKNPRVGAITYQMGERAAVGKLIYNVTHLEWKSSLGEESSLRAPTNRFLVLTATITNAGTEPASVPMLSLYDAKGAPHRELDDGDGVTGWLGLLRLIKPIETVQGSMLFDVPLASYKLQITDGAEPEQEVIAYVNVPLQLESDPVFSEPPAIAPEKKQ